MYRALYRKWRPRVFDDVIGQRQVTETLKNQIANGRTSHAYLFVGTRGTGKTTCAKILAKALNCENPENGNPCNKCDSCLGIENGTVMDVVEIDAASNNGVENVRALRDEAVYTPASVKKRVYIIDEVHMLSTSAFNALLKILEEPPEHLVFILATTELHKVLPTILSRCQRYSFRRISPEDVAERVKYVAEREGIALQPQAAELLGRLADGSLRDGLSLLDQCSGGREVTVETVLSSMGLAGNFRIAELLGRISRGEGSGAIELFEELWQEGKAPATVLSELTALLRDILMSRLAPKGGSGLFSGGFDRETLDGAGRNLTVSQAMSFIEYIQDASGRLRDGRDPKITAELCILGLSQPRLADTPEQLSIRISRLEKALEEGAAAAAPEKAERVGSTVPEEAPCPVKAGAAPAAPPPIEDAPPFDLETDVERPPVDEPPQASAPEENQAPPERPRETEITHDAMPTQDSSIWPRLSAQLKTDMSPDMYFGVLSDASAELKDGKLTLFVTSEFKKTRLESAKAQECVKDGIEKVLGRAAPFVVEVAKPKPNEDMLDRLARFGNVKFEN